MCWFVEGRQYGRLLGVWGFMVLGACAAYGSLCGVCGWCGVLCENCIVDVKKASLLFVCNLFEVLCVCCVAHGGCLGILSR